MLTSKVKKQAKKIEESECQRSTPFLDQNNNLQEGRHLFKVRLRRLEYKGNKSKKGGRVLHWRTKDHWSDKIKYNDMYFDHKTEEHITWRINMDKIKETSSIETQKND